MSTIGFCKGFISLNSPCMNTYFTRLCLCVLAVACTGSTFAYTTSDCDAVQDLVDRGIVNERSGCGDYGLDRSITRQEVAAIGLKIAEVCGTVDDVPEIYDYDLEYEDKFLFVASDGVWEFLSSLDILNIIKDYYDSNDSKACCEYILKQSSNIWINKEGVIDDISMILLFFD